MKPEYLRFYANSSAIAAHFDSSRPGKKLQDVDGDFLETNPAQISASIKVGKAFFLSTHSNKSNSEFQIIGQPFTIGNSTTP